MRRFGDDNFQDYWSDNKVSNVGPSDLMRELLTIDENDSKFIAGDSPIILMKDDGTEIVLKRL